MPSLYGLFSLLLFAAALATALPIVGQGQTQAARDTRRALSIRSSGPPPLPKSVGDDNSRTGVAIATTGFSPNGFDGPDANAAVRAANAMLGVPEFDPGSGSQTASGKQPQQPAQRPQRPQRPAQRPQQPAYQQQNQAADDELRPSWSRLMPNLNLNNPQQAKQQNQATTPQSRPPPPQQPPPAAQRPPTASKPGLLQRLGNSRWNPFSKKKQQAGSVFTPSTQPSTPPPPYNLHPSKR